MTRTYIPKAVDEAQSMSNYLARWGAKMAIGASSEQLVALANLAACVAEFLQVWFKPTPTE
jgi:hypothetical protein